MFKYIINISKNFINRTSLNHLFKPYPKIMLGRWGKNLNIMDKYEGKNYPY